MYILLLAGDWPSTSDIKNRVELVIHENFSSREDKLRQKEQLINKKLTLLGISKLDYLNFKSAPTIYVITPTHTRFTQKADLTRLSQTLLHIPKLHWIVVEDAKARTDLVAGLLDSTGLSYTHMAVKTSKELVREENEPRWLKARGVEQRNLGLKWIREYFDTQTMKGVVYFADDDNTYDLKLFEQVSIYPRGMGGGGLKLK